MKYIGPFLRINSLTQDIIKNQMSYFSRESLKNILLKSSCGIIANEKKLKLQRFHNNEINTYRRISPLLCVYKKASPRIDFENSKKCWRSDTFKQDILIFPNTLMNLSTIDLCYYYRNFENIDSDLYEYFLLYKSLCELQLDFYLTNMRNSDGLFVDKKYLNDSKTKHIGLSDKSSHFKLFEQSYLMLSYYRYAKLNPDLVDYESFSSDILKLLIDSKNEIYLLPFEERGKLLLSLILYNMEDKNSNISQLIIDIMDLQIEDYLLVNKLEIKCLYFINLFLLYKLYNFDNYKLKCKSVYDDIISMYDFEEGIIKKDVNEKEIELSSSEIILLLLVSMINDQLFNGKDSINIYKKLVLGSNLVLSWPDIPNIESKERYLNFSLKLEDLIDDINFRNSNIITPEETNISPIFNKSVKYNRKKRKFLNKKPTFDSQKEMYCIFLLQSVFKYL